MKILKRILFLSAVLFAISFNYKISNAYAADIVTLYDRITYVNDSTWGSYGDPGGGAFQTGGQHKYLGGYYGYYHATGRYIDMGTNIFCDGKQTLKISIGINDCDVLIQYSNDDENWTTAEKVVASNKDGKSEWHYYTKTNYSGGCRYWRAIKTGSRWAGYSGVDDLGVTCTSPGTRTIIKYLEDGTNKELAETFTSDICRVRDYNTSSMQYKVYTASPKNIDNYKCTSGNKSVTLNYNSNSTIVFYYQKYKHQPINDTYGISGYDFNDNRGYWVKQGNEYTIWAKAYDQDRNAAYTPNAIYYSLVENVQELGAIKTMSGQATYYRGSKHDDIAIQNKIWSNEENATAKSTLMLKINSDNKKINFSFTSSKDKDGYLEATSWKNMFIVNSDGKAPTGNVSIENLNPFGFDIVIDNVTDNGGSGVNKVKVNEYSTNNGNDDSPSRIFMTRVYQGLLGRNPDKGGLDSYSQQLDNNSMDELGAINNCINSAEFKNRNISNADYVKAIFKILLNREPDKSGYNYWLGQLNNGSIDKINLAKTFYNSEEYKSKQVNGLAVNKGNGKWTYHVNTKEQNPNDYSGDYKVQVYTSDNVNNTGCIKDMIVKVPSPNPSNGTLKITKYDYKENDNVYWVKQNNSFSIYGEGYFPTSYGTYPNKNEIFYAKDGNLTDNSIRQYAMYNSISGYPMPDYNNYLSIVDSGERLWNYQANNNNYSAYYHNATAKNDGDKFLIYQKSYYIENNITYPSETQNSGKWIKVDGEAPTGEGSINFDREQSKLTCTANNISDNGGSGVANVWVEIYPTDQPSKLKKYNLTYTNNQWQLTMNPYDTIGKDIDRVMIDIKASDNVGNESLIESDQVKLLSVQAHIVPYDKKDFNGDKPTLKRGQKATIIITTTGYVEKLKIDFPSELTSLDSTLNKTLTVQPKAYLKTEYDFYVPLKATFKDYQTIVNAIKGDLERNTKPMFSVNNSILDRLRTRRMY